jgi:hypothetical protein
MPLSSQFQARLPSALVPLYTRASTLWGAVGPQTTWIQTMAFLEIVHSLLGWVKSPIQTTVMQIASRFYAVWIVLECYEVVGLLIYFKKFYYLTSAVLGTNQPAGSVHVSRMVYYRSPSLLVLRVLTSPKSRDTLSARVAPIYHLLRLISRRRILRSFLKLCNSTSHKPDTFQNDGCYRQELVTNRLLSSSTLSDLVAK